MSEGASDAQATLVATVPDANVDPAVLDRVSDEMLNETLKQNQTLKEVMRSLEVDLGLAVKYLNPLKHLIAERISKIYSMQPASQETDQPSQEAEIETAAAPSADNATAESSKVTKEGDAKKKKKQKPKATDAKKSKSKKSRDGDGSEPARKKKKVDNEAEEDDEAASSDEEEASEGEDDYEYDGFVVNELSEDEKADEDSSSSSSSSGSDDEDGDAGSDGGKKRRIVQDEDDDLDEDDKLLIQEGLQAARAPQPAFKKPLKKRVEDDGEEAEEDEEEQQMSEGGSVAGDGSGRKRKNGLDEFLDDVQDDDGEGDGDDGENDVDELGSDISSGIEDSDKEDDNFVEDDDLADLDEEEKRKEMRRRRREKRKAKKANRDAEREGLVALNKIPEELRGVFDIREFDLYLSDEDDAENDEKDQRRAQAKLVAPEKLRALYLTAEDDEVRAVDKPERILLASRKTELLINFDEPSQVEMQTHYVAKRTRVSVGVCESALSLMLKDSLEVPVVHIYHADSVAALDLDTLWRVYEAGWDFQMVLQELLSLISLVKEKLSGEEPMEEKLLDEPFWTMTIESSLFRMDEEDEEDNKRSVRDGWLRLLHQKRLDLSHEYLQDCSSYLNALLVNGIVPDRGSKRLTIEDSKLRAVKAFHDRINKPLALGMVLESFGVQEIPATEDRICFPKVTSEGTSVADLLGELFYEGFEPEQVATKAMANLLFREPHIRAFTRKLFMERAQISTVRTLRGKKTIYDPSHPLYFVANIQSKPVKHFLDAFSAMPRTAENEKQIEQLVLMEQARAEGLLVVVIANESELESDIADAMQQHFCTHSNNDYEWENLRRKCLAEAIKESKNGNLIQLGSEFVVRDLTRQAKERIVDRASESFFKRIFVAPIKFETLDSPEDSEPSLYADVPPSKRVFASIVISDDPKRSPSFFVALRADGLEKFRQVLDASSARAMDLQIKACITTSQPHVIALNAHARARNLLRSLETMAREMRDTFERRAARHKSKSGGSDEDAIWKGWFVTYVVQDDFASAFAASRHAQNEFPPSEHFNLKRAVAMARYLIDPLSLYACMATDLELIRVQPKPHSDTLLSLNLDKFQSRVDQRTLLGRLERELINAVSLTGVDLPACLSHQHRLPALRFAPGMGYRKAAKLGKDVASRGIAIRSRADLLRRRLIGPNVFENLSGFAKVGSLENLNDESKEGKSNKDDDEYDEYDDESSFVDDEEAEAEDDEAEEVKVNDEEEEEEEAKMDGQDEPDESKQLESDLKVASAKSTQQKKTSTSPSWLHASKLDLTRAHPKLMWSMATRLSKLFCESKQNGSSGKRAIAFVLREMLSVPHDASFLEGRQEQLSRHLIETKSIHVDFESPALNASFMGDGMVELYEELFGRNGEFYHESLLGALLVEEIRFPFGDKRAPMRRPDDRQVTMMCSGEDAAALRAGSDVIVQIDSMPRIDIAKFDRPRLDPVVMGRVAGTSGVRVVMKLKDGDFVEANDRRGGEVKQLCFQCDEDPSALSSLLGMLRRDFNLFEGATVEARIIDDSRFPLRVQLKPSAATTAADSILDDLGALNIGSSSSAGDHWDPYFVPYEYESTTKKPLHVDSARPSFRSREIKHPNFKNCTDEEAEAFVRAPERKVGEIVFHPSARGNSFLVMTWRWSKDPVRMEHVLIEERNLDNTPKDSADPSLGRRMLIKDREFEALDEIIALYIDPMAKRINGIQSHKKFRPFEEVSHLEGFVQEQRIANPASVPYNIMAHPKENRTFYIVYMNSQDGPKRMRFVVRPEGLDLVHKKGLKDVDDLINYFKHNTRELETAMKTIANGGKPPAPGSLKPHGQHQLAPPKGMAQPLFPPNNQQQNQQPQGRAYQPPPFMPPQAAAGYQPRPAFGQPPFVPQPLTAQPPQGLAPPFRAPLANPYGPGPGYAQQTAGVQVGSYPPPQQQQQYPPPGMPRPPQQQQQQPQRRVVSYDL